MHRQEQRLSDTRFALRLGGACIVVGSLAVFVFRIAHGDPPAADPEAQLRFIADHWNYAGVHLGTIVGVLVWTGGMIILSGTLAHPFGSLLGRLGAACVLVGAAIFITDFTMDGVAGQDLARAWAAAPAPAKPDLVGAMRTAGLLIRGTSLVAIIVLWGVPLILVGRAVTLDRYPAWLGWTGIALGAVTFIGATVLLFDPDLFPGALVYGFLASIFVQLWSAALGGMMWRRAGVASHFAGRTTRSAVVEARVHTQSEETSTALGPISAITAS